MDMPTLLDRYRDKFEAERGPDAARRMTRFLTRFTDYIGTRDITAAELDDYSTHLRQEGLSASSANRHIGTAKAFVRWLKRRNEIVIDRDALDDWKRFKVDKPQPTVLTSEQVRKLLSAAAGDHRSAIRWCMYLSMGLALGARHSEICSVTATDVNTSTKEVLVRGTKTGVERRVPYFWSPCVMRILEHAREGKPEGPFVRNVRCESWSSLCKLAGIEPVPRSALRSTCAAYVASGAGLSEYLLSAWFGHGSRVAAEHYRQPMHNVKGSTIEEWYDAVDEFKAVRDRVCDYKWRT